MMTVDSVKDHLSMTVTIAVALFGFLRVAIIF